MWINKTGFGPTQLDKDDLPSVAVFRGVQLPKIKGIGIIDTMSNNRMVHVRITTEQGHVEFEEALADFPNDTFIAKVILVAT